MFIHWGIYSIPAGEWKGKQIPGLGEWIMNHAKIPVPEYEQLAKQFNPTKFDAEQWVAIAKNAGMKYIVITAKHHDGFAMFGSKVSPYNVVDATPFHRDPMKELADACKKAGIKLSFYYSQSQDWHEADGIGNDWDFPDESKKDFSRYFEAKAKPQVKELLTNYGTLGAIWFDTPRSITKQESEDLLAMVHQYQPTALVSGRVGNNAGDYGTVGDNQVAVGPMRQDWEAISTTNDTWGFRKDDNNWKPGWVLIRQLAHAAGHNGNYLLNVGPTAEGIIPQPAVDALNEMGKWMKANGESIYGSHGGPYNHDQSWGVISAKPGKLYLHVFEWPKGDLVLYGLKNKVKEAHLLADGKELKFAQSTDEALSTSTLRISVPAAAPDKSDTVVALDIEGDPQADPELTQQANGAIDLDAYLGTVHRAEKDSSLRMDSRGVAERWTNKEDWLDWKFKVPQPGTFDVVLITSTLKNNHRWEGGHKVAIAVADQKLDATVNNDGVLDNPVMPYWDYISSKAGRVTFAKAGEYQLSLKPKSLEKEKNMGLTLVEVKLIPVQK